MPFCKRIILPKDMCKPDGARRAERPVFVDLADVSSFALCSVLRQLADLSRHSVGVLEELEGQLAAACRRSGALEGRAVRLRRRVAALVSEPPERSKRKDTRAHTHTRALTGGGAGKLYDILFLLLKKK